MTKSQKLIVAAIAAVAVTAFAAFVQVYGSEAALIERFPEIDPKIVVKVSREMLKESLTGKYSNVGDDDAAWDRIFLEKVEKYTSK